MSRRDFLIFSAGSAALVVSGQTASAESNPMKRAEDIERLSRQGQDIIREAKRLLTTWFPTDWITETFDEPLGSERLKLSFNANVMQFPHADDLARATQEVADKPTAFTNSRLVFFESLRSGDAEGATRNLALMKDAFDDLRTALVQADLNPNMREFMRELNGWKNA